MFFDDSCDPKRTEQEFLSVTTELNNVTADKRKQMQPTWEACFASLKLRQGNIYLKKLFVPASRSSRWDALTGSDGNKKALECYWEARRKHESHVVNFSLAQAMEYDGQSALWKDLKPRDLFRDAFFKFRNQAILKTEEHLLDRFTGELLKREELDYDDIAAVFREYGKLPSLAGPQGSGLPPVGLNREGTDPRSQEPGDDDRIDPPAGLA